MAGPRRLTELVDSVQNRLRLPNGPFTVGLSGGADSAALAYLSKQADLAPTAVHIDHSLPGSPALRTAAIEIAGLLEIELEVVEVELADGASPEDRARDARYRVLDGLDRAVVTAHTEDDNAETILINLVRGTGSSGLSGIPYHRPPVTYRPMLDVTRNETREIAVLAGLPFRDDPMNADLALTRNRIRHRIMPLLRELNPRVVEALARAAATITEDTALLDSMVDGIDISSGAPVGVLTTLPRPLADRVLGRLLATSGVSLTDDRMERAWSVVRGEAPNQELARGLSLVRRGALVLVE